MGQRRHICQTLANNSNNSEMGRGHEGKKSVGAAQVVKRDSEHRLVGGGGEGAHR